MRRKVFFIAAIFTLTVFGSAAIQASPHVSRRSGFLDKTGILTTGYDKRYINFDLKTVKKKESAVEGEKRMVRYERSHRIGLIYHLV